jgi:hypothetical protein
MDVRRKRFAAALVLFIAWLAALGVMTAVSAKKPPTIEKTPASSKG